MEATLLEEEECVVAVGATKIVQEVKGGAATPKMVDVVGLLLTEEVEICLNEVAANLRQPNNWREYACSTLFRASSIPNVLPYQRLRTSNHFRSHNVICTCGILIVSSMRTGKVLGYQTVGLSALHLLPITYYHSNYRA